MGRGFGPKTADSVFGHSEYCIRYGGIAAVFHLAGQQYTSIKAKFDDEEYTGGLPSHARFGQDGQGVGTEASKKVKSKKMVKFVYLVVFQMNSY